MKAQSKKTSKTANPEKKIKKLGERIKKLRIAAGYTSYEYFAYDHDFSRTQFGRYERGHDLKFSTLVRLADAFGISVEELVKGI